MAEAPDPAAVRPPSVDALARSLADTALPPPLLVDVSREAIAAGDPGSARHRADLLRAALLRPVVNATGVLLHTNLGRAPLEVRTPAAYANLELDMTSGRRGGRATALADMVARLCGAEDALVVNNGAGALLLVLSALASGRAVVVSRGEIVEIGGGFRIPDVLASSGAALVEVGTTNRTRPSDYAAAVGDDTALVLKVHQSNYRMEGFTQSVGVAELARLGPPVVYDVGSGLVDATTPWLAGGPPAWLAGEPAARQSLEAGAALVTFSGDKLFGGPQAGIVTGSAELVRRCRRHPLARALRCGGLVLGALQDVVLAYLRRDGAAIPFWRAATTPVEALRRRADALGVGDPVACASVVGGGSLPGTEIPSAGVAVPGDVTAALLRAEPPVVARVHEGRTVVDLRTVDAADDVHLAEALGHALAGRAAPG